MASAGERTRSGWPSSSTSPAVSGRTPNTASASSVRPGPDQPGHAEDLAARTSKRHRRLRPAAVTQARRRVSTGVAAGARCGGPVG